ncbi:MAG: hypothetical protein PHV37_05290 [Candidatus Gastranaerophilales bacterium]|nr:hypothetical protein [Candidatus Gastranaerophilales bacterium]
MISSLYSNTNALSAYMYDSNSTSSKKASNEADDNSISKFLEMLGESGGAQDAQDVQEAQGAKGSEKSSSASGSSNDEESSNSEMDLNGDGKITLDEIMKYISQQQQDFQSDQENSDSKNLFQQLLGKNNAGSAYTNNFTDSLSSIGDTLLSALDIAV